jgi:hypothetical protein
LIIRENRPTFRANEPDTQSVPITTKVVSFIGGENHDLPHVTDKVYHIMLYLVWAGFELTTLVVIGTDWVSGSFDIDFTFNNYHSIDIHST